MERPTCPSCSSPVTFPVKAETTATGASMTLRCQYGHQFTVDLPRKRATS